MASPLSPPKIQSATPSMMAYDLGVKAPHIQLSIQKWGEIKRYSQIIHEFATDAPNHPISAGLFSDLYNISRVLVEVIDNLYIDSHTRRDSLDAATISHQLANGQVVFKNQQALDPMMVDKKQHMPQAGFFPYEYIGYYAPPGAAQAQMPQTANSIASPQIIPMGGQISQLSSSGSAIVQLPRQANGTPSQPLTPPQKVLPTNVPTPVTAATTPAAQKSGSNSPPTIPKTKSSVPSKPASSTTAAPPASKNFTGEVFFDDIMHDKPRRRRRTVYSAKRNLRCHFCHVTETPEWRRGPDGDHTLCNACGLHYAKTLKKKNKDDQEEKERKDREDKEKDEKERKETEERARRDKEDKEKEKEKENTRKHSIDFVIEAT